VKRSEIVAAMRQAQSEAEAGLYGESEEVAAYQRHLAGKVERVLGQIGPRSIYRLAQTSPISEWNAVPAAMANTQMKLNSSTSNPEGEPGSVGRSTALSTRQSV
jgi:hypothetical protein